MTVRDHPPPQRHDAVLSFSRPEGVVAVLVGCMAVDGVLRAAEARRLIEVLKSTRLALGSDPEGPGSVARRALDAIGAHGLPAVLAEAARAIPPELHATTFALAIDLMLADGRLGSRENAMIDRLERTLRIDEDLAGKIIEVLLIKNRASGPPDR